MRGTIDFFFTFLENFHVVYHKLRRNWAYYLRSRWPCFELFLLLPFEIWNGLIFVTRVEEKLPASTPRRKWRPLVWVQFLNCRWCFQPHLGTRVRIMKRRVRTAAMPFLLSVLVLCLSRHCMLVQLLREKVAALSIDGSFLIRPQICTRAGCIGV